MEGWTSKVQSGFVAQAVPRTRASMQMHEHALRIDSNSAATSRESSASSKPKRNENTEPQSMSTQGRMGQGSIEDVFDKQKVQVYGDGGS
jgi:hypothetical protein